MSPVNFSPSPSTFPLRTLSLSPFLSPGETRTAAAAEEEEEDEEAAVRLLGLLLWEKLCFLSLMQPASSSYLAAGSMARLSA